VRVWDPPRADIDVLALVERAHLPLAAGFGVLRAATHRPTQPADAIACFEDPEVVAQLRQFIPEHETGHAGTEHQDLGFRGASAQCRTNAGLAGHEIPGTHRRHDERRSTDHTQLPEKAPPRQHRKGSHGY
jgi:hypothetical protein